MSLTEALYAEDPADREPELAPAPVTCPCPRCQAPMPHRMVYVADRGYVHRWECAGCAYERVIH